MSLPYPRGACLGPLRGERCTTPPVLLLPWILVGSSLLGGIAGPGPVAAQESEQPAPVVVAGVGDTLTLGAIDTLAREHSPGWARLQSQFEESARGAEAEVRPSNPSLGWDVEYLDEVGQGTWEQTAFLEKSFRLPGFRRSLLGHVDERVRAAELERKRDEFAWLSEARRELVAAAVAREEVRTLTRLEGLVDLLEETARARAAEGELSGVEARLLEMGQYQLRSLLADASVEEDRRRARWEGRMAVALPEQIDFASEAARAEVELPGEGRILAWLEDSPAARADRQRVLAARGGVRVEQGRRWPGVDILAGVRRVTPEHHGFVVGAAVPLPLRDGNRAAIQAARAVERSGEVAQALRGSADRARALELVRTLERMEERLDAFPQDLADPDPFLTALVALYEDGVEPLSGVLSSLTLLADTYRSRAGQLELYFDALFELEALTGRRLLAP